MSEEKNENDDLWFLIEYFQGKHQIGLKALQNTFRYQKFLLQNEI